MPAPVASRRPQPTLGAGIVHLWIIPLDEQTDARAVAGLGPWEQERARRLLSGPVRDRYVAAHVALGRILGSYLGLDAASVPLAQSTGGKPFVVGAPLAFSLSHSSDLAVCAVAECGPLGADIEYVRQIADADGIVRLMFDPGEAAEYATHTGPARVAAFFSAWTRKEAFLKATGDGLMRPLNSFQVVVSPTRPAGLVRLDGDDQAPGRWSLRSFVPAPGYVGALAIEGALTSVEYFDSSELPLHTMDPIAARAARDARRS